MLDSTTRERIIVSGNGNASSHVVIPLDKLEEVKKTLQDNGIAYWVDAEALSLNNGPEVIFVSFGRGVSRAEVQSLLDSVL